MIELVIAIVAPAIFLIWILVSLLWRKKFFVKDSINYTRWIFGIALLIIIGYCILFPIWIYYDQSFAFFIVYLYIEIILIIYGFYFSCFCIFVDGNEVVKRTLLKETRIDISENGTFCEIAKFNDSCYVIVSAKRDKMIRIYINAAENTSNITLGKIIEIKYKYKCNDEQ